jgi:hypothetical protein
MWLIADGLVNLRIKSLQVGLAANGSLASFR